MAFLMNQMLGDKLKSFTGGGEDNSKAGAEGKETAESKGMSREEFEEYQRQLVEEKWVNDDAYFFIARLTTVLKTMFMAGVAWQHHW